jgi:hypothetical protein
LRVDFRPVSAAFARALLRQQRTAADDQPLAGKLFGRRDLRQIALVDNDSCNGPSSLASFWMASLRRQPP